MPKMMFPNIHNSGRALVERGEITFSYLESHGKPVTETRPVLTAQQVADRIRRRHQRFKSAALGARESDRSRRERKYVSAQPRGILRKAWSLLGEEDRMEFVMALDMSSHHGISQPEWMRAHVQPTKEVQGDDKREL